MELILVIGALWILRYKAAKRYIEETGELPPTVFS